jgi:hypothetical protein
MPHDRLVAIADRLLDLTRSGRLRWQAPARPRDAEDGWESRSFATRLPKGTVVVESAAAEGRYPYGFRVLDTAGAEVGRLETGQDAERFLGDGEADPWELTIHDLYAEARKSAVNPEAVLDSLIEALDQWAGTDTVRGAP